MVTDDPARPARAPTRRILLVEDDPAHAELIQRSLEAQNDFVVSVAESLSAARDEVRRTPPDLVLSDYRLPDGEGVEIVDIASGAFPVVMMTSQGNERLAVQVMKAGVLDYVVKSMESFDALPRIVERAMREWALTRERRAAEMALKASEARHRALFEQASEGILFLSKSLGLLSANASFARMHGHSVDEILGLDLQHLDVGTTPELHAERVRRVLEGEDLTFEVEHHHKLGHTFPLEVSLCRMQRGDEEIIVAFHRDLSERREAERLRLQMERQLQQTQRLESLGVLAGGIAHDFNNLLMVIQGHTDILRHNLGAGTRDHVDLDRIEMATSRAAELCRQMLSYAGRATAAWESVDLRALASEMASLLTSSISKKIDLKLDLYPDVPRIQADPSQLRQVVMNLIINGAEAIGDAAGDITLRTCTVAVTPASPLLSYLGEPIPERQYAAIVVTDTGCGMDQATAQRVFDPFFTTKCTGRGLGMSAVLGIVSAHQGHLLLDSHPGHGTTFTIFLPIPTLSPATPRPILESAVSAIGSSGTVLLVEDEAMVRDVATALLQAMGLSVITEQDGCEALETYARHREEIDLIMVDMAMPRMDGAETFRELRRRYPGVAVVMSSGYTSDDVATRLLHEGLQGFIHKPYTLDSLRRTLAEIWPRPARAPRS